MFAGLLVLRVLYIVFMACWGLSLLLSTSTIFLVALIVVPSLMTAVVYWTAIRRRKKG